MVKADQTTWVIEYSKRMMKTLAGIVLAQSFCI